VRDIGAGRLRLPTSRAWCSWPETDTLLTDTQGAAAHLASDPACALALVPVGEEGELTAALAASGKAAARLAEIDGINYSSGKTLTLGLYHVASQ